MMELMVPLPSHPSTFTATTLASLATPTIRPAATEATCVPCPSQSEAFQSLLPSEKSHLHHLWYGNPQRGSLQYCCQATDQVPVHRCSICPAKIARPATYMLHHVLTRCLNTQAELEC